MERLNKPYEDNSEDDVEFKWKISILNIKYYIYKKVEHNNENYSTECDEENI
jgi:hypothetical protein